MSSLSKVPRSTYVKVCHLLNPVSYCGSTFWVSDEGIRELQEYLDSGNYSEDMAVRYMLLGEGYSDLAMAKAEELARTESPPGTSDRCFQCGRPMRA